VISTAQAQDQVSFDALNSDSFPSISGPIQATFQKGAAEAARKATVVILHGAGGVDGRGQYYAAQLYAAGISILELTMFAPGQRFGPSQNRIAYAFSALRYLQSRTDIAPYRIGVLGFSSGGQLAMKTAIASIANAFMKGQPLFVAHAANYPVCWVRAEEEAAKPSEF
jgi:dienelactone hydrolase